MSSLAQAASTFTLTVRGVDGRIHHGAGATLAAAVRDLARRFDAQAIQALDVELLAEAGTDSAGLVRAMDENDARERAAAQLAEAQAEAGDVATRWRLTPAGRADVARRRKAQPGQQAHTAQGTGR